ncbi:MAG TPA: cupredoxin domain-containing protein [Egibacteraceae bacterium]|nr:cupredoxin domain-containing protein [Egibacteraceae bacterium]
MRTNRTLVLLAAATLILAGCGGAAGDVSADGGHGGDHAGAESVHTPVAGADSATIRAVDIDFEPDSLELQAGEPVNVTVVNEGRIVHDFTLEEADVHLDVEPGESAQTSLTIDEPGTYRAICTVTGHENAGMVVEVEVR